MDNHPAQTQLERRPLVFTAHAAETAYLKEQICAFVLAEGCVPVNPFMSYGYFLFDLVPKDVIRRANNNLIMRCDELWWFGPASDGVLVEIELAQSLELPVRSFELDHYGTSIVERRSSDFRAPSENSGIDTGTPDPGCQTSGEVSTRNE